MTNGMGLIIELLVAILLMFTIAYCMLLNRRLKLLRADEDALRGTIAELVTATEIAERAIAGLKVTARECDLSLGERLTRAERLCVDLDRRLAAGKDVVGQLTQIAVAGRRGGEPNTPPPQQQQQQQQQQDAQAIAAAAQAFSERLRSKVLGIAA